MSGFCTKKPRFIKNYLGVSISEGLSAMPLATRKLDKIATPSVVQRDFQRIISLIGTSARSPKTRENFIGRVQAQ